MYDRLQKICEENDISITKLCVEITGSKGNLSTWKKGHMMSNHLIKVADFFNISVDYLLGRTDNPNSHRFNLELLDDNSTTLQLTASSDKELQSTITLDEEIELGLEMDEEK